jgi:hypothetical protein
MACGLHQFGSQGIAARGGRRVYLAERAGGDTVHAVPFFNVVVRVRQRAMSVN